MGSTIPAARTWLLEHLPAVLPEGMPVQRSALVIEDSKRRRAIVLNATEIEREWLHLGQRRMQETYILPVYLEVEHAGQDLEVVETRLWDAVAAVERLVAENPTFDGLLRPVGASPDGASDPQSGPTDDDTHLIAKVTLRFSVSSWVDLAGS